MLKVWLPLNGDLTQQGTANTTFSGTPAWKTYGKIGNAALNLQNKITCTTTALNGVQFFSVTFWTRIENNPDSTANWMDVIGFTDQTSGGSNGQFRFETGYGNTAYSGVHWHDNATNAIINGSYTYNTGTEFDKWHHIAVTVSDTAVCSYYDGILKSTLTTNLNKGHLTGAWWLGESTTRGCIQDVRIYDNVLSAAEVREISQGLVLHYKLDGMDIPNENLGNTSADYHNFSDGYTKAAGSWGGDAGTVTFHHSGGYAGLPYKELHKTATGTGGIYSKTADDIILESNTTYTMSCWIKASRNFRPIHYSFNINRGVGNVYITYGNSFDLTTEWQFFSKTFTTTADQAGSYGEMSIIYDDDVTDYYIYYSGFKIEKGTIATRWTPPGIQYTTIQDSSGYNHNGTILNTVSISSDTPRYSYSTKLEAANSMINCGRGGMVTDSITVNMWIKSSAWANPVSCTEGGGWNFEASGDYFRFPVYVSGVGYKYGQSSTTKAQICNNQWHMLTGIYDRINQKIQIYVDGQLDNDYATGTSNNIGYHGSNCIWIGAEATGSNTTASNGMVGLFSDFRIYCTALSVDDILELYHTGAKIDNKGNTHTYEFVEYQDNILFPAELSRTKLEFTNGLNRYTQANCQVNLVEDGYHIYRPPNLTQSANGSTMWGGLKLVNQSTDTVAAYDANRDNWWHLQQNHTYIAAFHVRGKSSNATTWSWTNNMGWGGGGVQPSPTTIVNEGIPADFNGEKDCFYIFTITDAISKPCTTAYSAYTAGTTYLSYRHLTFGWGYTSTGTLGTDLYLTNFRLYDITSNMAQFTKQGQANFYDIVEQMNKAQIRKNSELLSSEFIEL